MVDNGEESIVLDFVYVVFLDVVFQVVFIDLEFGIIFEFGIFCLNFFVFNKEYVFVFGSFNDYCLLMEY